MSSEGFHINQKHVLRFYQLMAWVEGNYDVVSTVDKTIAAEVYDALQSDLSDEFRINAWPSV